MCEDAIVFNNKPKAITLESGKSYNICQCGKSEDGVFCDGSHTKTNCLPKKIEVETTKAYQICMCKASKNFPFCDGTHSFYADKNIGEKV